MLEFDEAKHEYHWDGNLVPSVTQVLAPLSEYAGIPKHILDRAAARGQYIHTMCEYHLWNTLDESTVDPKYLCYLTAFKAFLQESGFKAEHIEERVYHERLKYAGTSDMIGELPGKRGKKNRAIIDIKTTFKLLRAVGPQTAGYGDAWNSMTDEELHVKTRWGLQLKKDGTYKLKLYNSRNDSNIFRSCLAIHNFMKREEY